MAFQDISPKWRIVLSWTALLVDWHISHHGYRTSSGRDCLRERGLKERHVVNVVAQSCLPEVVHHSRLCLAALTSAMFADHVSLPGAKLLKYVYCRDSILSTYGHSQLKTGHPVRSAIHKQLNGRLVLRWVTTWESLLLYVLHFCISYKASNFLQMPPW